MLPKPKPLVGVQIFQLRTLEHAQKSVQNLSYDVCPTNHSMRICSKEEYTLAVTVFDQFEVFRVSVRSTFTVLLKVVFPYIFLNLLLTTQTQQAKSDYDYCPAFTVSDFCNKFLLS